MAKKKVAIIVNPFRMHFFTNTDQWCVISHIESERLYKQRRQWRVETRDAAYMFGDGDKIRGLAGSYHELGYEVSIVNAAYLGRNIDSAVAGMDVMDCNFCSYPDIRAIETALLRDVLVTGYRHPFADMKNVQAYILSSVLRESSAAFVPKQAYIPAEYPVTDAVLEVLRDEFTGCGMLLCKGNLGADLHSNGVPYVFFTLNRLHDMMQYAGRFNCGMLIQEVIATQDFYPGSNAMLHKIHCIRHLNEACLPAVEPLSDFCIKMPQHLDNIRVEAQGSASAQDVLRCLGRWLKGNISTVLGIPAVCKGIERLDPLGSVSSVDLIITPDGRAGFLESTHFAATLLETDYSDKAPVDYLADIPGTTAQSGQNQREVFGRYLEEITHYTDQGWLDNITITGGGNDTRLLRRQ